MFRSSLDTSIKPRTIRWPRLSSGRSATPADATHWSAWPVSHTTNLGRLRLAAAPLGDVQALQRSALQGPRHRRPVSLAAGPRAGGERSRRSTASCRSGRAAHAASTTERPHCSPLDVAFVIGKCHRRHRARESRLPERDRPLCPRGAGHPRRHGHRQTAAPGWHPALVHFTPTSASWINQVERQTRKQLQRGVHTSTRQLEADIRAFIEKPIL